MGEQLLKKMGQFMVVSRKYRDFQRSHSKFQITERETIVLDIIHSTEGIVYTSEISRIYQKMGAKGASQTTVSLTVNALWDRGFIDKTVDRTNPKVVSVQLTKKGNAFLEERRQLEADRAKLLLSELLSPQEAEIIELYLDRMTQRFQNLLGGG